MMPIFPPFSDELLSKMKPEPVIESNLKSATDLLVASILKAKSAWLDSVMVKVLPKDIYKLSTSGKGKDTMKLARWLAKNSYEIKEGDGFSQVWVGGTMVSEWRYRMENGKVEQFTFTGDTSLLIT